MLHLVLFDDWRFTSSSRSLHTLILQVTPDTAILIPTVSTWPNQQQVK